MSFLTEFSLRQRAATFLLVILVTLSSIYATLHIQTELIPDIELPMVDIVTVYPGALPEKVAETVTVPVEKAVSDVKGLKNVQSTSAQSLSQVALEFEPGTNMEEAERDVSQKLSRLSLPSGAQSPQIIPFNLEMFPVLLFSISGDLPPEQLTEIADSQVASRLRDLDGVSTVALEGASQKKVIITTDTGKMNEGNVSVSQIAAILQGNNLSLPSGEITIDGEVIPLRTSHQFTSRQEIENMIVGATLQPAKVYRLKDVAQVSLTSTSSGITRTNGKPSVGIMVFKKAEANTVAVAEDVMAEINKTKPVLDEGVQILTVFDQSSFIERSIRGLTWDVATGAILVIGVVFLFLLTVRASLVIALSIPLSVLFAFLLMHWRGITINLITLSALSIAVGKIVDDSIVVVENIYRHIRQGESFREAAVNGTKEVAGAITSATITTVAVFLPLAFLGGVAGKLFIPFALTLTFALAASLLIALMVVPPLSSFLRCRESSAQKEETWYQRAYVRLLRWFFRHRALTLVIAVVLFLSTLSLLPLIGTSFLPNTTEKLLVVEITLPVQSDETATSQKAAQVEEAIAANLEPHVYHTIVGTPYSSNSSLAALLSEGQNIARIFVLLNPSADLENEADKLRRACQDIAGSSTIRVYAGNLSETTGTTLRLGVYGEKHQDIAEAADRMVTALQGIEGIANVGSAIAAVKPEISIAVNPVKAMYYGLSAAQVGAELYQRMMGQTVTQVTLEGKTYDVYIAGIGEEIDSLEKLEGLKVGTAALGSSSIPRLGNLPVALEEIATVELEEGPVEVQRINGKLASWVTASITKPDVGSVNRQVQDSISSLELPAGVEVKTGGVAEDMARSFSDMRIAIIVAIVIAYVVMVVALGSLLNPLIILSSLPLASIGAFPALFLTQRTLGVPALMGLLMLVGIVLTNAIVLITFVEQLRRKGMSTYEALVEGGRLRLRPILMTALTTMIALVPLSLGLHQGALIGAELATVVIGGLFTSTFLTLLVIPVIYSLFKGSPIHNDK